MSEREPIYGVDLSHWNRGFSMWKARGQGIKFVVLKATEGPYRDGSKYTDPDYRRFRRNARLAGIAIRGAYHFLVATNPERQAIHFLKTVGNPKGKLLMVDFEAYPNFPSLTPGNWHLKAFIREVKKRTEGHPILLYSGQGFWNGGDSSGLFTQYGAEAAWDAFYPLADRSDDHKALYHRVRNEGWGKRWGGVEPLIWQYSPAGKVGGMAVDVNAFRGSMDDLRRLTR